MHACPEHGDDGENRPFRVQRRSDKSNETAVPPSDWEDAVANVTGRFAVAEGEHAVRQDDYHEYLVCNWALSAAGGKSFEAPIKAGPVSFHSARMAAAPLRELSEVIYGLQTRRSSDWHLMRDYVCENVSEDCADMLLRAEAATDCFETSLPALPGRACPHQERRF